MNHISFWNQYMYIQSPILDKNKKCRKIIVIGEDINKYEHEELVIIANSYFGTFIMHI